MPTTVMHIDTTRKTGKAAAETAKEKAAEAGETVKEFAGQAGKPEKAQTAAAKKSEPKLDVITRVEKPKTEAVAEEARKGYDMLIIGLAKTVARQHEFADGVARLAAGFEGPLAVVDARELHRTEPLRSKLSILVPVNGTDVSRRAAEVAIVLARASKAPLTALYVNPGGKKGARTYEEAILKDIVALADTYDVGVRTAVRSSLAPDDAILKETARSKHNLVVMGVGRRPGDKLFFGDTASALLEKSEVSLLFVAS
jgi:nucleotide-binding universal stress UspA family protein